MPRLSAVGISGLQAGEDVKGHQRGKAGATRFRNKSGYSKTLSDRLRLTAHERSKARGFARYYVPLVIRTDDFTT